MNAKTKFFVITCLIFPLIAILSVHTIAQSPQGIKYQSIIRDSNGDILPNHNISLKISFLVGNPNGTVEYSETHAVTTNEFGLVNIVTGNGNVLMGDFSSIDWGGNIYFMKTEVDPLGGTNYQLLGTSQVLAVPYSYYAEKAGNVVYSDTSATNELQTISRSGLDITLSEGGGTVSIADNDNDPVNELQVLSISNDTIFLENGGFVKLPDDPNPISGSGNFSSFQVFDTPGTFSFQIPLTVTKVMIELWGAGADAWQTNFYCAGGGGGYGKGFYDVLPGTNYLVTVGAASGGTSSFGSLIYATGGNGTIGGTSNGQININGGSTSLMAQYPDGGDSPLGGSGGKSGGTNFKKNGEIPGGGGAADPYDLGSGAHGRVIVFW